MKVDARDVVDVCAVSLRLPRLRLRRIDEREEIAAQSFDVGCDVKLPLSGSELGQLDPIRSLIDASAARGSCAW